MPKRRSLVILRKVTGVLKRSVCMAKLSTRSIIPRLLFKRSRRMNPRRSYHYLFLREYEFSDSSTPLVFHSSRGLNRRGFRDLFGSVFYLCGCQGVVATSAAMDSDYGWLALPPVAAGDAFLGDTDSESVFSDEETVDQRAERFIEKFYEEMRMQRRVSI